MSDTTKAVWNVQQVRDQILAGKWVDYCNINDPGVNTLWAWGCNLNGQLGDGTTTARSSPVQVPGEIWSDVSGGGAHSLAFKTDGTLWAWGENGGGQIGDGTVINRISPVQIPGTAWNDVSAGAKISSDSFSLARKTDGTLWAWGLNTSGRLGDGTIINRSSPVQIPGTAWNDVSIGACQSFARKTDGTLWAWGANAAGNLGDGTKTNRSSPVQVPGAAWNDIVISSITGAGTCGTALARKTDGTLWGWGDNALGQIGDGTKIDKSSPVQVPGAAWNDVSAGGAHSLARKTDGTLWAWGCNKQGQVGDGTVIDRSSPVQVPGEVWNDVSGGSFHSVALKTDNTLWSWGCNANGPQGCGQLGDGTVIDRSSPVQVPGTFWKTISGGGVHTLAIKKP